MAAFETVKLRRPSKVFVVPVTAFSDDWKLRPTAEIAVGLRLLSEEDAQHATRMAATSTVEFLRLGEPGAIRPNPEDEASLYNARIMAFAVARSVCDPNDVTKCHESIPALEDHVFKYFTPAGIRLLFEALQTMTASLSPASPVADDDDVLLVATLLKKRILDKVPSKGDQLVLRRLLAAALDLICTTVPEGDLEADVEDDEREVEIATDGESTYELTVRAPAAAP